MLPNDKNDVAPFNSIDYLFDFSIYIGFYSFELRLFLLLCFFAEERSKLLLLLERDFFPDGQSDNLDRLFKGITRLYCAEDLSDVNGRELMLEDMDIIFESDCSLVCFEILFQFQGWRRGKR